MGVLTRLSNLRPGSGDGRVAGDLLFLLENLMSDQAPPPFDLAYAHRYFASTCFNLAWTYIDRSHRNPQDDEAMVLATAASLWHWTQREDCVAKNLSIGHWQLSRAYALAGQGDNSMRHALRSLEFARDEAPFYVGYGHEAAARAANLLGDATTFVSHRDEALALLAAIEDESERLALKQDLTSLHALCLPQG